MPFSSFRLLSGTWLWELELYCWECRWGTSGGDKDLWKGASSDDENTDDTADENTDGTDDIDENTGALQVAINVYEMGEWCDENPASLFSRSGTWGLIWTRKTEEGHTDILQTFEHCSINAGTQTFLLSKDVTHRLWTYLGLLLNKFTYVTHWVMFYWSRFCLYTWNFVGAAIASFGSVHRWVLPILIGIPDKLCFACLSLMSLYHTSILYQRFKLF